MWLLIALTIRKKETKKNAKYLSEFQLGSKCEKQSDPRRLHLYENTIELAKLLCFKIPRRVRDPRWFLEVSP